MHVLILANGDPPSPTRARAIAEACDLLIATDGAVHRAFELGLRPDIVCGDFDSADLTRARTEFPSAEFIATPDQNFADLEKALLLAMQRNANSITILGAAGGRMDHTLTAVALLFRYHKEVVLRLADDYGTTEAISGTLEAPGVRALTTEPGDTISLAAFSMDNCVSLQGVAWPLREAQIPVGTHGVSNKALEKEITLTVLQGVVLLCHLKNLAERSRSG